MNILKTFKSSRRPSLPFWIYILLSAVGMFYVLYVFEGYGIDAGTSLSGHSLLFRSILFGLVNGFVIFFSEWWVKPKLSIKSWLTTTIWHGGQFFFGALCIFVLFNYFWSWTEWHLAIFFEILIEYVLIMLVPLGMMLLVEKVSKPTEGRSNILTFTSENGKEELRLHEEDLLYLKSDGNYVEIYFVRKDEIKSHLLRNSLKAIAENETFDASLTQCHRSYLVNEKKVRAVVRKKGKIVLDLGYDQIPVGAKYQTLF